MLVYLSHFDVQAVLTKKVKSQRKKETERVLAHVEHDKVELIDCHLQQNALNSLLENTNAPNILFAYPIILEKDVHINSIQKQLKEDFIIHNEYITKKIMISKK